MPRQRQLIDRTNLRYRPISDIRVFGIVAGKRSPTEAIATAINCVYEDTPALAASPGLSQENGKTKQADRS